MPWSGDEGRCRHCDAKLPLYVKLSKGQFCTKAHKAAYAAAQDQLALEVLHQTHDSIRAYRPPEDIESILGPSAGARPRAGLDAGFNAGIGAGIEATPQEAAPWDYGEDAAWDARAEVPRVEVPRAEDARSSEQPSYGSRRDETQSDEPDLRELMASFDLAHAQAEAHAQSQAQKDAGRESVDDLLGGVSRLPSSDEELAAAPERHDSLVGLDTEVEGGELGDAGMPDFDELLAEASPVVGQEALQPDEVPELWGLLSQPSRIAFAVDFATLRSGVASFEPAALEASIEPRLPLAAFELGAFEVAAWVVDDSADDSQEPDVAGLVSLRHLSDAMARQIIEQGKQAPLHAVGSEAIAFEAGPVAGVEWRLAGVANAPGDLALRAAGKLRLEPGHAGAGRSAEIHPSIAFAATVAVEEAAPIVRALEPVVSLARTVMPRGGVLEGLSFETLPMADWVLGPAFSLSPRGGVSEGLGDRKAGQPRAIESEPNVFATDLIANRAAGPELAYAPGEPGMETAALRALDAPEFVRPAASPDVAGIQAEPIAQEAKPVWPARSEPVPAGIQSVLAEGATGHVTGISVDAGWSGRDPQLIERQCRLAMPVAADGSGFGVRNASADLEPLPIERQAVTPRFAGSFGPAAPEAARALLRLDQAPATPRYRDSSAGAMPVFKTQSSPQPAAMPDRRNVSNLGTPPPVAPSGSKAQTFEPGKVAGLAVDTTKGAGATSKPPLATLAGYAMREGMLRPPSASSHATGTGPRQGQAETEFLEWRPLAPCSESLSLASGGANPGLSGFCPLPLESQQGEWSPRAYPESATAATSAPLPPSVDLTQADERAVAECPRPTWQQGRLRRLRSYQRMSPTDTDAKAKLRSTLVMEAAESPATLPSYEFQILTVAEVLASGGVGRMLAIGPAMAGFWRQAPRDLKALLCAIPLLIALAFHPSLPKVAVKVPQPKGALGADFQQVFDEKLSMAREAVMSRAAIVLDEDFRQGLDNWSSNTGAVAEWSFDQTGFVHPGPLALYRPTQSLSDYQFQFLGTIDEGALSWVVRAKDFENYYVVKLVTVRGGPLPMIALTRYAVIDGEPQDRVDTRLPISARLDTLYRVQMDLRGDNFNLLVQGQMVDTWSEPRLDRGGIGFFTGRGEQSRVRWVQLTHQYDMLGRLCAYLAPYNFSNGISN